MGDKGVSESDARQANYNRQVLKRDLVLPSNIMNQKQFHFILKSPYYPFVRSSAEYQPGAYPNKVDNFILKDSVAEE